MVNHGAKHFGVQTGKKQLEALMHMPSAAFLKVAFCGATPPLERFGDESEKNLLEPLMHQAPAAFPKVAVCGATPMPRRLKLPGTQIVEQIDA
jgi:hypothetical protein